MRFATLVVVMVGVTFGATTLFNGSALATHETTGTAVNRLLLASPTATPKPATPSPTASPHASSSPTAAAAPKTGGPPAASGDGPFVYLLIGLGVLGIAGAGVIAVRLRRPV
jgi:hypothetical protein